MSQVSVYVTAPDREAALTLARAVLGERLAACANLLPGVTSVYRWEGALHEDPEVAMILKTRADAAPALMARLRALHPYKLPCIVAWPIAAGDPDYLAWIDAEVAPPPPTPLSSFPRKRM